MSNAHRHEPTPPHSGLRLHPSTASNKRLPVPVPAPASASAPLPSLSSLLSLSSPKTLLSLFGSHSLSNTFSFLLFLGLGGGLSSSGLRLRAADFAFRDHKLNSQSSTYHVAESAQPPASAPGVATATGTQAAPPGGVPIPALHETATTLGTTDWLQAIGPDGSVVLLGSRIVLETDSPESLAAALAQARDRDSGILVSRRITARPNLNLVILEAADALAAANHAARLSQMPGVRLAHPVRKWRRSNVGLHINPAAGGGLGLFAPAPNDPFFPQQWHLDNWDTNRLSRGGIDLNTREAWATTRGGIGPGRSRPVLVACADNGMELTHADLAANVSASDSHNFALNSTNGAHGLASQYHGTAVAGLIAAVSGNNRGISGVAPEARLASLVVFDSSDFLASEEGVMNAFEYHPDQIDIQNHSWGNTTGSRLESSALEDAGMEQATTSGRGGLGTVFVRSSGNTRALLADVNDDEYAHDPRAIAVAAVRINGRVAGYSTPGACVLVAAPSGEFNADTPEGGKTNYAKIVTTDRTGSAGANNSTTADGQGDYLFGSKGFDGTSAAAPQISGLAALLLSARPGLGYRDVQEILALSARQTDPADPAIRRNGAGLAVSHNTGFGVPDAAIALRLAASWIIRPAQTNLHFIVATNLAIPDDALRVMVSGGAQLPAGLQSIPANPADGLHPDDPLGPVGLVDLGQALTPVGQPLAGKAALIQRGGSLYAQKISYAAAAGASLVLLYNNSGGTTREFPVGADVHLSRIPTVFLGQTAGESLRSYLTATPDATVRVQLNPARIAIPVTNTLSCEWIGLRVRTDHPRRADLRITLLSPSGTRSVLAHYNQDVSSAHGEWTYYSRQSLFEGTAGTWQVEISDERAGMLGSVQEVELILSGVSIVDSDNDGLDDSWEIAKLGSLASGPADDPDGDGWSNLYEYLLGTNPLQAQNPFAIAIARRDNRFWRLTWPAKADATYEVLSGGDLSAPPTSLGIFRGAFEAECVVPTTIRNGFFQVRRLENQNP